MNGFDYWKECVQVAAEECGATLTHGQIDYIAGAVEISHENYALAFYSPPASDRIAVIEGECRAKVKAAQDEADRVRSDFVTNVCMRHRCNPSDVTLEGGGHVTVTIR